VKAIFETWFEVWRHKKTYLYLFVDLSAID